MRTPTSIAMPTAYIKAVKLPTDVKMALGIKPQPSCPRLDIVLTAGVFTPLERVRSTKDGHIHFNITRGVDGIKKGREIAETRIQDNKGCNFTSVCVPDINPWNGKYLAYGNPNPRPQYKRQGKSLANPYYNRKNDGYIILTDENDEVLEIFVFADYLKGVTKPHVAFELNKLTDAVRHGEYNEAFEALRAKARVFHQYLDYEP